MRRWLWSGVFVVTLILLASPVFAQCAMCKTALTNSSEGQRLANNFNHAILIMFVAPYLVFFSFVVAVFRGRIRGWLTQHVPLLARFGSSAPAANLAP
jgi:hypothetical protein